MSTAADTSKSPRFYHNIRDISSPWANVVRGGAELAPVSPSSLSAESFVNSNRLDEAHAELHSGSFDADVDVAATTTKKPAWNKLSNGVIQLDPVMDASSWPALSESSRATTAKLTLSDSLRATPSDSARATPPDGSPRALQVDSVASSIKGCAVTSPKSTHDHVFPVCQKLNKRGDRGSPNGSPIRPSPDAPQSSIEKATGTTPSTSPRGMPIKGSNWDSRQRGGYMPQSHTGNDQVRYSYRSGTGGHYPRGNNHHHSYGNRRDQDRGNYDWSHHRGLSSKDLQIQQPRPVARGFIRPHPSPATFISVPPPPPPPPYGNPLCFPEMASTVYYVPMPHPDAFRGLQFLPHPGLQPLFLPAPDPQLQAALVMQIDYYFSPENLCKDIFLRQNMDEHGWVPVSLIANFNRVKKITSNIPSILEALQTSTVVEVQGDRIRKRNDWMNWTLPPQVPSAYDLMTAEFRHASLEDIPKPSNVSDVKSNSCLKKVSGR